MLFCCSSNILLVLVALGLPIGDYRYLVAHFHLKLCILGPHVEKIQETEKNWKHERNARGYIHL